MIEIILNDLCKRPRHELQILISAEIAKIGETGDNTFLVLLMQAYCRNFLTEKIGQEKFESDFKTMNVIMNQLKNINNQ